VANLEKIDPIGERKCVRVVIETPRGASAKFKYDPEIKACVLSKELVAGLTFPFDFGFVPSTLAPDGDPIDALVIHDTPTYPGIVVDCQLIGVLEIDQKQDGETVRNDRLIFVPVDSHRQDELNDARELPARLREEIECFFRSTAELQKKKIEVLGWRGPRDGAKTLERAMKALKKAG